MFYGPPGCGKTLLGKSVANIIKYNFKYIKSPQILNKYVGESEKILSNIFSEVQNSCPILLFFDEIDAITTSRVLANFSTNDKTTHQFLLEMDEINSKNNILVIGATNFLSAVDTALIRTGR